MATSLRSARRHHGLSALIASRAVREARKARGLVAILGVVTSHQITQAQASERAIAAMLAEQDVDAAPDARLNLSSFTTEPQAFVRMSEVAGEAGLARLIESLVQDAGRAAESVSTAVRPRVGHVRNLTPPSCSRCVVLAGRVYRYSDGFQRHPNCDCTMTPVREGDATHAVDPLDLMKRGLITDLSKADAQAIRDGADLGRVVNIRRSKAGLRESGRVLARSGRMTPEGIYRRASTRDEAVALLASNGYIL